MIRFGTAQNDNLTDLVHPPKTVEPAKPTANPQSPPPPQQPSGKVISPGGKPITMGLNLTSRNKVNNNI